MQIISGTNELLSRSNRRQLQCKSNKIAPTATSSKIRIEPVTKLVQDLRPEGDEKGNSKGGIGQSVWNVLASSQSFASQLLSHFSRWPGSRPQSSEQAEKVLLEASEIERVKQLSSNPVDIKPYLSPVGVWEAKHLRHLSHLSGLTYRPNKVNSNFLRRAHNLRLVVSSWSYQLPIDRTFEEALDVADGMAAAPAEAYKAYNAGRGQDDDSTSSAIGSRAAGMSSQGNAALSPQTRVTNKLIEAYSAASGVAAAAASPLASAAGSIYAGLTSLPIPSLGGGNSGSGGTDSGAAGSSRRIAASLGQAMVLGTQALADGRPWGNSPGNNNSDERPAFLRTDSSSDASGSSEAPFSSPSAHVSSVCPSEWYVVDDDIRHLRIFVIQGSDSIDHWKLNLTFDPVVFEDPAFGVTVHRGVYEAAQVLYERFLPMVSEHLETSPFAKVTFTGHSIGGCLATLLMFMYKQRDVLPARRISTVYTFGAPSVFCEAPLEEELSELAARGSEASPSASTSSYITGGNRPPRPFQPEGGPSRLMASLGLRDHAVRNVIMHRDIVPRAFSCDYSPVSDILRGWGPGFRDHAALGYDGRKHLYYFVGRMIVLQPDRWHSFVGSDPDHPMLPPGPSLLYLADPAEMLFPPPPQLPASTNTDITSSSSAPVGEEWNPSSSPSLPPSSIFDVTSKPNAQLTQLAGKGIPQGRIPASAHEAVMELMDNPHPLETLADPNAYLSSGTISRYHNPDNYTSAFGRIIHLRRRFESGAATDHSLSPLSPARLKLYLEAGSTGNGEGLDDQVAWDSSYDDFQTVYPQDAINQYQ